MKLNEQMSMPSKRPESAVERARRENAMMAATEGQMARELEWEARHGAGAAERKEFARRMAAVLRRSEQWSREMLA